MSQLPFLKINYQIQFKNIIIKYKRRTAYGNVDEFKSSLYI